MVVVLPVVVVLVVAAVALAVAVAEAASTWRGPFRVESAGPSLLRMGF